MIGISKLRNKFFDKGYIGEYHFFVLQPPWFILGKTLGTQEEQYKAYKETVYKVYGEEWEYWNQWIDHQNYK